MFASKTANIPVNSTPEKAEVFIDGVSRGMTPLHLVLDRNRSYTIVLKKEGMADSVYELRNSVGGGWVVLDVLLAGLIGVAIDASTGAWYQLDETPINIAMRPPEQQSSPAVVKLPPCNVTGTEEWKQASPAEKKKLLDKCRQQPQVAPAT